MLQSLLRPAPKTVAPPTTQLPVTAPTTPEATAASGVSKPARLSREDEARLALEHTVITLPVAWSLSLFFLLTIFAVPIIQIVATSRARAALVPRVAMQFAPATAPQSATTKLPATPFMNAALLNTAGTPMGTQINRMVQGERDWRSAGQATWQAAWSHVPTAAELKTVEDNLTRASVVSNWLMPPTQEALLHLGAGNEQVMIGRDHWLMYRPDVEYLTERGFLDPARLLARARTGGEETAPTQPNPVTAIVHFQQQLARRGIRLIVMPIPLKPMLYPEQLSSRYAAPYDLARHPLQNPSYAPFLQNLAQQGVAVCDVTGALLAAKQNSGQPQFLQTDTHWTPTGMQVAATELARFIHERVALPARPPSDLRQQSRTITNRGDIAAMLKLPASSPAFAPQTVTTEPITTPQGKRWRPSHQADVILLGDSFTNIYSRPDLGWGQGAGLAEQLAYQLQRPLDVIAINAGGASGARARLREDLVQGEDRLAGKKLVVWQFAMRDLASGDWQLLDLPPTNAGAGADAGLATPVIDTPAPAEGANRHDAQETNNYHALTDAANAAKLNAFNNNPSASEAHLPSIPSLGTPANSARLRQMLSAQAVRAQRSSHNLFPGRDGWLFYLPDVFYMGTNFLQGTPPHQLQCLLDFNRQLKRRGIQLVVVPLPPKNLIYPEKLGTGPAASTTPLAIPNASETNATAANPTAAVFGGEAFDGSAFANGLPQNPAFTRFCRALTKHGIACFDATPGLLARKAGASEPLFIPTDTHWAFAGVDAVAQDLAAFLQHKSKLPSRSAVGYTRQPLAVRNVTDISMMLEKATADEKSYVYRDMTVQQVKTPDGQLWHRDHTADVLLLGDSFTNIYSQGGYWGRAAGLAEQLSYYLQRPLDSIAVDGGGVDLCREQLQDDMLHGEDRLAGKKIVICEFACRYLMGHPWKIIHFPPPAQHSTLPKTPRAARHADSNIAADNESRATVQTIAATNAKPQRPHTPPRSGTPHANPTPARVTRPGTTLLKGVRVRGIIKARAIVPPPNTMPYKDLIMAVRLTGVKIASGPHRGTALPHDIIVYVWAMRDQTLTPAAAWKAGQSIEVPLTPWREVEDDFGSYNRVGLEGRDVLRLDAYWGEAPQSP